MSTIIECDNCGGPISDHYRQYRLNYDGPRTLSDRPFDLDFCSVECVASWAALKASK